MPLTQSDVKLTGMSQVPVKNGVKRVLAAAGHNRRFPRRFPAHLGGARFWASTEGSLKLLKRSPDDFDPTLLPLTRRFVREGMNVWDIGANVGVFTFAAAGLVGAKGSVTAIEADTWCVDLLRRSSRMRQTSAVGRVTVIPVAVSDRIGVASFEVSQRARAVNHLAQTDGSVFAGAPRETQSVPTLTLDTLRDSAPRPDVVKIDIEGAEKLALAGATALLREDRPVLIMEAEDDVMTELVAMLDEVGYAFETPPEPGTGTSYTLAALPNSPRDR